MKLNRSAVFWCLAYGLTVAAIVWLLGQARAWAVSELARPQAVAKWQQWKANETERSESEAGPVRRRPPKSDEPPLLVILRDNYAAVLASCLLLGTALFVFFAIVVQGARTSSQRRAAS